MTVDEILYTTRPADNNRPDKEIKTYDLLEKLGINYVRIDHEPAYTIDACESIDRLLGLNICKNLLLCNRQKTLFFLLMLPGNKKFDTKVLSSHLGISRLSFAQAQYMEEYLNITPGSLSPLGLAHDKDKHVKLLIDREVYDSEYFGCHPCVNTSSLKIKMSDFTEIFLPYVEHDYTIVDL